MPRYLLEYKQKLIANNNQHVLLASHLNKNSVQFVPFKSKLHSNLAWNGNGQFEKY